MKAIHVLFGRPYLSCDHNSRFFLHRRKAEELIALFRPIARDIRVSYSELFFHPDVLVRWNRFYPRGLEAAIGETGLARYLARQIHIRFEIPAEGSLPCN